MHAIRSLRRTPVFAAAAILTLALGIGAVASAFAIAHGLLLAPLPYGNPDRLVSVGLRSSQLQTIQLPPAVYVTYKRHARSIEDIGFHRTGNANVSAVNGVDAQRLTSTWVTASTIPLLQVSPILGRPFSEVDDQRTAANVVMISEWLWQTYFNSSRDVIGKSIVVNAIPREIIGVMPRSFMFPTADTKLWLTARLDRDPTALGDFAYSAVARLTPDATPEMVQRESASLLPKLAESFPRLASGLSTRTWLEETRPTSIVIPLRDAVVGGVARTLWMLAAAAALVLIVALANVANLMLIRADARQLELSVRAALGASRMRIATPFLGESIALVTIASAAALFMSWGATRALVAFGPQDLPRLAELRFSPLAVMFVAAVALAAVAVCTFVPTIRLRAQARSINLRDGGRGETAGRARQRVRSAIAAGQLAVALVVIAGSMLLLRTFQRYHQARPGFEADNVVTAWTQLPFARYGDSASVAFYGRLTGMTARLPGVVSVGVTSRLPLGDGDPQELTFRNEDGRAQSVPVIATDGSYFATMTIPLLAGRTFVPLGQQRDREIMLSRRAAKIFFGDADLTTTTGRRLSLGPAALRFTVIGVVDDVRDHDLGTPPAPTVYMPQAIPIDLAVEPAARRTMALVVKTTGSPGAVVASVRRAVGDIDTNVPVFNVEPMTDIVRASTARLSFLLAMMSAAAVVTLLLGAIGLYGVMAYMVALRTRELGIRIALGADPRQVARGVVRRALAVVGGGVLAGLALYAGVTPFLRGFLYGVTAADPATIGGAVVALIATACVATWLPARRAGRVDPAVALRAE